MSTVAAREVLAPASPRRFLVYALVFAMGLINYSDRAALSVTLPLIIEEFHLTPRGAGWLLSTFFWSYFVFNFPSALLVDRFGPRRIGAVAVGLWSCAMALGGLSRTLPQLVATRLLLGVGEAPSVAIGANVIARWAPPRERGTAMTWFISGSTVGVAVGATVSGLLIHLIGWRPCFVIFGVAGLVWVAVWRLVYRDPAVAEAAAPTRKPISLPAVFTSRSFWGVASAQVSANFGYFLLQSWLPTYLHHALKVDVLHSGIGTAVCYLGAAILAVGLGRIGEICTKRLALPRGERRYVVAAFLVGASAIGLLGWVTSPPLILLLVAWSLACIVAAFGTNVALQCDLIDRPDRVGSLQGVILTFSNGIGLIAPIATGYIVQSTASFGSAFLLTTSVLWCGCIITLLTPRAPLLTTRAHPTR